MSGERKLYTLILLLSLSAIGPASGQVTNPRSWFPLEVGSYWHRQHLEYAQTYDWVEKAVADTVIDGSTWTIVEEVYCSPNGDPWCWPKSPTLYRFSDDLYLLRTTEAAVGDPDTVWATQPRSVFETTSTDRLYWWNYSDSVDVEVVVNSDGNPSDSTDEALSVFVPSCEICNEIYIYKVGAQRDLVGAVVSGIEYGNVDLISSIVLGRDNPFSFADHSLQVFPNPSVGALHVSPGVIDPGTLVIEIYDVQGRLVQRESLLSSSDVGGRFSINLGDRLAGGIYMIRAIQSDGEVGVRPVVLLR